MLRGFELYFQMISRIRGLWRRSKQVVSLLQFDIRQISDHESKKKDENHLQISKGISMKSSCKQFEKLGEHLSQRLNKAGLTKQFPKEETTDFFEGNMREK